RRIGIHPLAAIEAELVAVSGRGLHEAAEITVGLALERGCRAVVDDDLDRPGDRRPDAHVRRAVALILRTDRQTSSDQIADLLMREVALQGHRVGHRSTSSARSVPAPGAS